MGAYDIPAIIDKVLEVSGQKRLFYIGHSMGTTGFLVIYFAKHCKRDYTDDQINLGLYHLTSQKSSRIIRN